MVKSKFMQSELEWLNDLIEQKKEEKKVQKKYGYHVDVETGKIVYTKRKSKVVKTIRIKKKRKLK
tara:strand:+ start:718 stop:912 length:195 start_codon:yes stop_codon:yes gene_type:complete